jgi:hypothetical protein
MKAESERKVLSSRQRFRLGMQALVAAILGFWFCAVAALLALVLLALVAGQAEWHSGHVGIVMITLAVFGFMIVFGLVGIAALWQGTRVLVMAARGLCSVERWGAIAATLRPRRNWWIGPAFMIGGFCAALYIGTGFILVVLGMPWPRWLGVGNLLLFASFVLASVGIVVRGGIAYWRGPRLRRRRPVVWRGKLVGWVPYREPIFSRSVWERWLAANTPEAEEFQDALANPTDHGIRVWIDGIPAWIKARSDDSGRRLVRWRFRYWNKWRSVQESADAAEDRS